MLCNFLAMYSWVERQVLTFFCYVYIYFMKLFAGTNLNSFLEVIDLYVAQKEP